MRKYFYVTAIILLLSLIGCAEKNKKTEPIDEFDKEEEITEEEILSMFDENGNYIPKERFEKNSYLEKDDGWLYNLKVVKDDEKTNIYSFGGFNLKYHHLDKCYATMLDENDNVIGKIESVPALCVHEDAKEDIDLINDFLNKMQFNKKISEKNLKDIKLNYIDKKDIVYLVNQIVEMEYIDVLAAFNEYYTLPYADTINIDLSNKNRLLYSYYYTTKIDYIHTDIIYDDGSFLSELIDEGKATEEQIELYNNLKSIADYVYENQNLRDVKSHFPNFSGEEYEALYSIFDEEQKIADEGKANHDECIKMYKEEYEKIKKK